MKGMSRSAIALMLGVLFVSFNAYFSYTRLPRENIGGLIGSDSYGYYQYLPALFIEKNVLHQFFALHLENGYSLNKFTCGVALMESPFYFIGETLTRITDAPVNKGKGPYFMLLMAISGAVYLYLALWVLFLFIRKKFDLHTAWYAVIILYLGTNIYYYVMIEPGMSHLYSLFCFSMCVAATDRYYHRLKRRDLAVFAFFCGLATLIRPTNFLILFFFLGYEVYGWKQLKERALFLVRRYSDLLLMAGISIAVAIPQMIYWYKVTGSPLVFSYGYNDESFSNLGSPRILSVLFGYKSGWLFYTPVMLFSLAGLYLSFREKKHSAPVILLVFLSILYLCASWWFPTFGCAFGYRSFIEYYAILVLPLAFFAHRILQRKDGWRKSFLLVSFLLVYLNLKITYKYVSSGGCWDGPDFHWSNFMEMMKGCFSTVF